MQKLRADNRRRMAARPARVEKQYDRGTRIARFNAALAVAITKGVGSMWCAYAFAVVALVGLQGAINGGVYDVVQWTAQTFLQLVLLGSVTLGGRRVAVARPRMRASDGSGELPVPAYELFSSTEVLGRMAMERMLAGLSTRHYPVGLEPVGERVSAQASATSKSAVSRRFVAATEAALAELLAADLSGLDLVGLMVDGVHWVGCIGGKQTKFPVCCLGLDGVGEFGEDRCEPLLSIDIPAEFIVTATKVLHERVPSTVHP